jgi:uncharacterized membrane protein
MKKLIHKKLLSKVLLAVAITIAGSGCGSDSGSQNVANKSGEVGLISAPAAKDCDIYAFGVDSSVLFGCQTTDNSMDYFISKVGAEPRNVNSVEIAKSIGKITDIDRYISETKFSGSATFDPPIVLDAEYGEQDEVEFYYHDGQAIEVVSEFDKYEQIIPAIDGSKYFKIGGTRSATDLQLDLTDNQGNVSQINFPAEILNPEIKFISPDGKIIAGVVTAKPESQNGFERTYSFIFKNETLEIIPPLGRPEYASNYTMDMNSKGDLIGNSDSNSSFEESDSKVYSVQRGFLWSDSGITEVGPTDPQIEVLLYHINDQGVILGSSYEAATGKNSARFFYSKDKGIELATTRIKLKEGQSDPGFYNMNYKGDVLFSYTENGVSQFAITNISND